MIYYIHKQRENTKHNKNKIKNKCKRFLTNLANHDIIKVQTKKGSKEKMSKILGKVEIGGERFNLLLGEYAPRTHYCSLESAYERPSTVKHGIWNYWKEWFNENSDDEFDYISIAGRNAFCFTINGRITVNGEKYTYYISKTRQELYKAR